MSKKVVLKLEIHDDKDKQKAMKAVSSLSGIESISMDMKAKKLTVVGEVDPIQIVSKLRKVRDTQILTVGPAKEPVDKKKEEEEKKKKEEEEKKKKKEEEEEKKKLLELAEQKKKFEEERKRKESHDQQIAELWKNYRILNSNPAPNNNYYHQYHPNPNNWQQQQHYYHVEENPNSCVIS